MNNFKRRVTILESMRAKADIHAMSDAELDVHIDTLEFGTTECYSACIVRVLRHPSAFPVARRTGSVLVEKSFRPMNLKRCHWQ